VFPAVAVVHGPVALFASLKYQVPVSPPLYSQYVAFAATVCWPTIQYVVPAASVVQGELHVKFTTVVTG